MTRRNAAAAALAVLVIVVATTSAQAQGRRFNFGGLGGFGGDPILSLVRVNEVLEEIEVVDDQKSEITKILEESRSQRPRIDFRELSQEEREKAFADMRKKMQEQSAAARKKLDEVLLPHQLDRLKEINIQNQGVRALATKDVAEDLELTQDQQDKIASIQEKATAAFGELFRQGRGGFEGLREKMTELREKNEKDLMAVLTNDQQTKFEELKGEPFEMPQRQFNRRGRGQGGEGRPRRPSGDDDNRRPRRPSSDDDA